jgi:hypothetical protein
MGTGSFMLRYFETVTVVASIGYTWPAFNLPRPIKSDGATKFGRFGAANIE